MVTVTGGDPKNNKDKPKMYSIARAQAHAGHEVAEAQSSPESAFGCGPPLLRTAVLRFLMIFLRFWFRA